MTINKIEKIENEIKLLKELDYSLLDAEHSFMVNGILGGLSESIKKIQGTFMKQILLGIMSGVIIGFGYVACITAIVTLPPAWSSFGIILLGFIFPGCIILITFLGGALFTSHVFSTLPVLKGCESKQAYFKGIFGVLLGNFLGTLIFVLIYSAAGGLTNVDSSSVANKSYEMGIKKLYMVGNEIKSHMKITGLNVFFTICMGIASGILCNLIICATLLLTFSTKNSTTIFFLFIYPISYFAIGGFQHGPANTFFLWMMLVEIIFTPSMQVGTGDHVITPEFIHFILFLTISSVPTLFGNWVGGAILLPGILHLINSKYTNLLFKKKKLEYLERQLQAINSKLKPESKKEEKL